MIFLGNRTDTYRLYQAMDVFVFPSRYEGLGMAAVEAQFCGVKTIMSDRVPGDAYIAGNTMSVPLHEPAKVWAEKSLRSGDRAEIDAGRRERFDIETESVKLANFYGESAYGEKRKTAEKQDHLFGQQR